MTNYLDTPIGKGGLGTVYLGYKDDGLKVTKVAVKILSQKSDQGTTEFQNEIEVLMKVQHKNLVPFIGYCDDGVNRALVYEYMSCGNLNKYLGLEHLHSKCEPCIVHRDIKSENILLDENLVAKVADFGLCKFLPEDVTRVMKRVMGSFGYLDPEYYNTHALNEKSDVYSYRVVLHELITGKSAIIKELTPAHLHVTNWVRAQANIKDVADLRMEGKYHMMSLDKAIKIAKKCTPLKPASRPSMSIVVSQLGVCLDIEKHRRNQDNNTGSGSGSFFTPPSTM
ncbi:putative leucine-rich repeat receptor-like serine/threonine-protein kinase [Acorus calamus]|uniref:Leucine-rich repeat receptor-like serine/threonine-protein kinase n=1 Tax=Acorus calamus TaxID=4465 RepID=A0AAV9ENQ6_ACOCL|nr:putative leucine-rich repeat receptor-like serine/threonine-protein kinase [Acorus calamus]